MLNVEASNHVRTKVPVVIPNNFYVNFFVVRDWSKSSEPAVRNSRSIACFDSKAAAAPGARRMFAKGSLLRDQFWTFYSLNTVDRLKLKRKIKNVCWEKKRWKKRVARLQNKEGKCRIVRIGAKHRNSSTLQPGASAGRQERDGEPPAA